MRGGQPNEYAMSTGGGPKRPKNAYILNECPLRPFLSHASNPLRGFFAFRVPLPDCGFSAMFI